MIGPNPCEIGGISIHIRRLVYYLHDYYYFDFVDECRTPSPDYYNIRKGNLFSYFRKVRKADIVHIQSGHKIFRIFHVLFCRYLLHKKCVVTVHRDPNVEGKVWTKINRLLLSNCNVVICVNSLALQSLLRKNGRAQYFLIPAFLPPIIEEEPDIPYAIDEWIQKHRNCKDLIVISNAYRLIMNHGQDLYGLDLCIDVMIKMASQKIAMIFIVADNPDNGALMSAYKQKVIDNNLCDKLLIWEGGVSFPKLIQESDVVLRATNTDGDSLTVREGLLYNKIVVASDVVERPNGTLLFKNRSVDDLENKLGYCLCNPSISNTAQDNYIQKYIEIYNSISPVSSSAETKQL